MQSLIFFSFWEPYNPPISRFDLSHNLGGYQIHLQRFFCEAGLDTHPTNAKKSWLSLTTRYWTSNNFWRKKKHLFLPHKPWLTHCNALFTFRRQLIMWTSAGSSSTQTQQSEQIFRLEWRWTELVAKIFAVNWNIETCLAIQSWANSFRRSGWTNWTSLQNVPLLT